MFCYNEEKEISRQKKSTKKNWVIIIEMHTHLKIKNRSIFCC